MYSLVLRLSAVFVLFGCVVAKPADAQHCNRHIYNNSSDDIMIRFIKSEADWEGRVPANTAFPAEWHNDVRGLMIARNVNGTMEWEERVWPFTGFTGDTEHNINFIEGVAGRLPGKVGAAARLGTRLNVTWLVIKEIFSKPDCYWIHEGRVDSDVYGVVFNDPANGDIIVIDKPAPPSPPAVEPEVNVDESDPIPWWNNIAFYGTTALEAGFSEDPRRVTVSSAGGWPNPLAGPGCAGYINTLPTLIVDYTAGSYSTLTFSAAPTDTPGDLTLVVRTPSGAYHCDDDSGEGTNPRVDIDSPESGEYRIWAGVYSSGVVENTVLAISEVGNVAE